MKETPTRFYKWYVLGVLFLTFFSNYVDRTIMSVLQVPIKKELHLSDTQMGLLLGIAFTLFYSSIGLPMARLADRTMRNRLLAGALALWSIATIFCGYAANFLTLLLFRAGVAAGEGGGAPPSTSLISDYFPLEGRATAFAIWTSAAPIGAMFGLATAGWFNSVVGWRLSFVFVGLSGLVLVPLLLFTVRDPVRGIYAKMTTTQVQPGWAESLKVLWNTKSYRYMVAGATVSVTIHFMFLAWNVPFFVRVHHMSIATISFSLALTMGLGGLIGTLVPGIVVDRLVRTDPRWYMLFPGGALFLVIPVALLQFFSPSFGVSMGCAFFTAVLSNCYLPPTVALAQAVAPPAIKAFTSALQVMIVTAVGGGLSPLLIGALSDSLIRRGAGNLSLRYAMAAMLIFTVPGIIAFWWGSRFVSGDIKDIIKANVEKDAAPVARPGPYLQGENA